jgi:hypothetical protein
MSRTLFGSHVREILDALRQRKSDDKSRPKTRRSLKLESLEDRAILTISATGLISSAAAGANFNYTIALTSSSSSTSSIGTFWFAWTPGQDYLATRPISVTPPPGWIGQITHAGTGDGFSIEFLAADPALYLKPGSTTNFSFQSADTPQSFTENSVFYTTKPVGTSVLYPLTPFTDGVTIDVTPAPPPPPPPPPPAPPGSTGAALVTLTSVSFTHNKRHLVTQITVDFSGAVNMAEGDSVATYRLALPGKKGSFVAKNARVIGLRSAVLNSANTEVTLTPKKPFALTKPVQLSVNGQPVTGLKDSDGRLIDGNRDGVAGGSGVAILRPRGATLS